MSKQIYIFSLLIICFFSWGDFESAKADDAELMKLIGKKISSDEEFYNLLKELKIEGEKPDSIEKRILFYDIIDYRFYKGKLPLATFLLFENNIFLIEVFSLISFNGTKYVDSSYMDTISNRAGFQKISLQRESFDYSNRIDIADMSRKPPSNPLWESLENKDFKTILSWFYSFDPTTVAIAYYSLLKIKYEFTGEDKKRLSYLKTQKYAFVNPYRNQESFVDILNSIDYHLQNNIIYR